MASIVEISLKFPGGQVVSGEAKDCNAVYVTSLVRGTEAYHWDDSTGRLELVRKIPQDTAR